MTNHFGMFRYCSLLLLLVFFASSCGDKMTGGTDDDGPDPVNFDRRAMLTDWASFNATTFGALRIDLGDMVAHQRFVATDTSAAALERLRTEFHDAYLSFQRHDLIIIGKAEEIRFREQYNTYPTDVDQIEVNVAALAAEEAVNLELPSQTAAQGFPALEYLLFGLPEGRLLEGEAGAPYRKYLTLLLDRMIELNETVHVDRLAGSFDAYVQNDGNSATASIDRTVNDFIFYYEKFLRAGKVGIPAGVFSDEPLADRVESRYAGRSKALYLEALASTANFFKDGGLAAYLDALGVRRDGELLSAKINNQFQVIQAAAGNLEDDFGAQVNSDNTELLRLYDEMQKLVVLLKVDMLQALSINVDYVDADGD